MIYPWNVALTWDEFQVLQVTRPRIGIEARLALTPCAGVFLKRAVIGGADRIPPCPGELLDLMRAGFTIPPICSLRYFATQAEDFNYDYEDL